MECLIPTFSFDILVENYFTSFRRFTRLRVNNIRATGVLDKNRLRKCIIGDKQLQKRESGHFEQRSSSKKTATLTVVGSNNSRAVYIASSESCEPKRFAHCWNKVERKYIREQLNQFHWVKYRIGIQTKKCWWSPFVLMVDVVLQDVWV